MGPFNFKRQPKPIEIVLLFALVNLIWRLAWLTRSQGAYTDGILQITSFGEGLTFWPPLYPLLAMLFSLTPSLGLEGAARLVSVIAGSAAVFPIEAISRRLFGRRASLMALAAYTASPMALRWSVQVMTDATFMLLWLGSLAALLLAAEAYWPKLFDPGPTGDLKPQAGLGLKCLLAASLLGALATLTRFQGVLLAPVLAVVVFHAGAAPASGEEKSGARAWMTLGPWLIVPLWLVREGPAPILAHLTQIAERTSPGSGTETAVNYWFLFEEYVLTLPYFVTYGLFGFALFGLFRMQFATRRIRQSAWAALYLALALLAMQSVFQAFQERYLLPLIPIVCIAAGHGLAVWEKRCASRPALFWGLAFPSFAYALVLSALVAFYQGNPFIDLKRAGRLVAELPEETRIFSTEVYNREIGAAKLAYWSGGRTITPLGAKIPEPGDFIVLPSFYGAIGMGPRAGPGWVEYQRLKKEVKEYFPFPAREVQAFGHVLYPLFPDIMEETFAHTNPLAFIFRYRRQRFETVVFEVFAHEREEGEPMDEDSTGQGEPQ